LVTHPDAWPAQMRTKVAVASNDNGNLIIVRIYFGGWWGEVEIKRLGTLQEVVSLHTCLLNESRVFMRARGLSLSERVSQ